MSTEFFDAPGRFALAVFRVNGLLMRNGDRLTRPLGLSSAHWQVLGRAVYGPQTVAQMAREQGQARQSVQRVADVLEKAGLVVFRDAPGDKRTFLVEPTEEGRRVLSAIEERQAAWSQVLLERLKSETLTSTAAALEGIAAILESLESEEESL